MTEWAFHIILVNPEIPPNTGNIIRLSANTGIKLHLVEPLGFVINDKNLRRAGLDYHESANCYIHPNLAAAYTACGQGRRFALTGKGATRYDTVNFMSGDICLMGCESVGLSADIINSIEKQRQLYIPMRPNSRSFNLSNATAIIALEAWRQNNFIGSASAQ